MKISIKIEMGNSAKACRDLFKKCLISGAHSIEKLRIPSEMHTSAWLQCKLWVIVLSKNGQRQRDDVQPQNHDTLEQAFQIQQIY